MTWRPYPGGSRYWTVFGLQGRSEPWHQGAEAPVVSA